MQPARRNGGSRAPARLAQFSCAVPEHIREIKTPHMAHPGCFATTILLAAVPALAQNDMSWVSHSGSDGNACTLAFPCGSRRT